MSNSVNIMPAWETLKWPATRLFVSSCYVCAADKCHSKYLHDAPHGFESHFYQTKEIARAHAIIVELHLSEVDYSGTAEAMRKAKSLYRKLAPTWLAETTQVKKVSAARVSASVPTLRVECNFGAKNGEWLSGISESTCPLRTASSHSSGSIPPMFQ